MTEARNMEDFLKQENVCFYDATPDLNKFATPGSEFEKEVITKNPQLLVKLESTDITASPTVLTIEGFVFEPTDNYRINTGLFKCSVGANYRGKYGSLHIKADLE